MRRAPMPKKRDMPLPRAELLKRAEAERLEANRQAKERDG